MGRRGRAGGGDGLHATNFNKRHPTHAGSPPPRSGTVPSPPPLAVGSGFIRGRPVRGAPVRPPVVGGILLRVPTGAAAVNATPTDAFSAS
jgi:hypothetical protein